MTNIERIALSGGSCGFRMTCSTGTGANVVTERAVFVPSSGMSEHQINSQLSAQAAALERRAQEKADEKARVWRF